MRFLFLLSSFVLLGNSQCTQKEIVIVRETIKAEVWQIEPKDGSIYRKNKYNSTEFIYSTDDSARDFMCFHKDDIQSYLQSYEH